MDDTEHNREDRSAAKDTEHYDAIPCANEAHFGELPSANPAKTAQPNKNDLIAQARELLKDPEFMEEVMELVKLRKQLEKELMGLRNSDLLRALQVILGSGK